MKDLVKNPIGIIALFISLIYAMANLLLGTTAKSLSPCERWPLILFIVAFPVVVLGAFYRLVTCHHWKLYAPGDYKADESFLRTLSPEERDRKLDIETQESIPVESTPEEPLPTAPNLAAATAGASATNPNIVTLSTSAPTASSSPEFRQSFQDFRRDLEIVESRVISILEQELNQTAQRDVGIGNTRAIFDAAFKNANKDILVEIKFFRNYSGTLITTIDRALYNAVLAERYLKSNIKLIIVIVYSFDKAHLPTAERRFRERAKGCPVEVEFRFIARSDLGT